MIAERLEQQVNKQLLVRARLVKIAPKIRRCDITLITSFRMESGLLYGTLDYRRYSHQQELNELTLEGYNDWHSLISEKFKQWRSITAPLAKHELVVACKRSTPKSQKEAGDTSGCTWQRVSPAYPLLLTEYHRLLVEMSFWHKLLAKTQEKIFASVFQERLMGFILAQEAALEKAETQAQDYLAIMHT